MKKTLIIINVVLYATFGLSYELQISNNTVSAVFEDVSLSTNQYDFIFTDLKSCFNEWGKIAKIEMYENATLVNDA